MRPFQGHALTSESLVMGTLPAVWCSSNLDTGLPALLCLYSSHRPCSFSTCLAVFPLVKGTLTFPKMSLSWLSVGLYRLIITADLPNEALRHCHHNTCSYGPNHSVFIQLSCSLKSKRKKKITSLKVKTIWTFVFIFAMKTFSVSYKCGKIRKYGIMPFLNKVKSQFFCNVFFLVLFGFSVCIA